MTIREFAKHLQSVIDTADFTDSGLGDGELISAMLNIPEYDENGNQKIVKIQVLNMTIQKEKSDGAVESSGKTE